MIQAISTVEARSRFSQIVNRAAFGGERIALMRHGRKVAAIVPFRDMMRLEDLGLRQAPRRDPDKDCTVEALRREMAGLDPVPP